MTIKANGEAGVEVSTPGVEAGNGDTAASSPKGEFSVTGSGEFARTWKFDSEDEADDFVDDMVDKAKSIASPLPGFLKNDDDYDPPPEEANTVTGSVTATAKTSAPRRHWPAMPRPRPSGRCWLGPPARRASERCWRSDSAAKAR